MSCYGEVWISEKGCSCGIGSGAVEDWELQAELSHKPGHFLTGCAVILWMGQGLACPTRLFTPVDWHSVHVFQNIFFSLRKSVHLLSKSTLFWDDIMETTVKIILGVVWLWEMELREL